MSEFADVFSRGAQNYLFEAYPDGLAVMNRSGRVLLANRLFQAHTGFSSEGGRFLQELLVKSDRNDFEYKLSRFFFLEDEVLELSYTYQSPVKSPAWCDMQILKLGSFRQDVLFVIFRDITGERSEQYRLVKERRVAEQMTRSTMEILANTSHELRTPIHTIVGMTELLQDSGLDEEKGEYCSQIRYSADILQTLINDILDYSKLEAGMVELEEIPFQLPELLESAVDLLTLEAHRKLVDIAAYYPPDIPLEVIGDPVRLRQVLVNLINNAVKFTEKGSVIVTMNRVREEGDKEWMEVRVSDTGIGIPEDKREKLFIPFQQADTSTSRKFGGTGLGLYITKTLVEKMGGLIDFISEEGAGTEFFFTLSFRKVTVSADPIPTNFYAGMRTLVVDDNPRIREILRLHLVSWGCLVDEAGNYQEAVELFQTAIREKRSYQLCLIDQLMPGGDGWQLSGEIRNLPGGGGAKIILLLMKGKGTEESKMMKLGWVNAYLKKPVRRDNLLNKIFTVLNEEFHSESDIPELEASDGESEGEAALVSTGRKILIAEDHVTNQQLFKLILEKEGFDVLLASDGEEAVSLVGQHPVDLIFMDCQMPVLNGYAATRRLRDNGFTNPIIAVTASAVQEERNRCLEAGMTDLLTKPFKRADLVPMLEQYLIPGEGKAMNTPKSGMETEAFSELAVFDEVDALETFTGEREILKSVIPQYRDKTRDQMARLESLEFVRDTDEIKSLVHSIKGSSRNLSLERFGLAAELLEADLKRNDLSLAEKRLGQLKEEYLKADAALATFIGS